VQVDSVAFTHNLASSGTPPHTRCVKVIEVAVVEDRVADTELKVAVALVVVVMSPPWKVA
jgi:hypothetical protein